LKNLPVEGTAGRKGALLVVKRGRKGEKTRTGYNKHEGIPGGIQDKGKHTRADEDNEGDKNWKLHSYGHAE
jgi:hypothetical protein